MLSKLIKHKIENKFGQEIRYPKDCDSLAEHISQVCNTRISSSTLRRLYGFVKGIREPRMFTLDLIAKYVGLKDWTNLLASLDKSEVEPVKIIEKLKPAQVKNGQTIIVEYEPGKQLRIKRAGALFKVTGSNERKLLVNDEIDFRILELHYPLTLTKTIRAGKNIGRVQTATVSGITAIAVEGS